MDAERKELERAKIISMLDKYYRTEPERRALCVTNKIPFQILAVMFNEMDPQRLFDLENEIIKEIYDLNILILEECGYIVRSSEGRLELTAAGQKFMEDIQKRQ